MRGRVHVLLAVGMLVAACSEGGQRGQSSAPSAVDADDPIASTDATAPTGATTSTSVPGTPPTTDPPDMTSPTPPATTDEATPTTTTSSVPGQPAVSPRLMVRIPDHLRYGPDGLVEVVGGIETRVVEEPVDWASSDGVGGFVHGRGETVWWHPAVSNVAVTVDARGSLARAIGGRPTLIARTDERCGEEGDFTVFGLHDLAGGGESPLTCVGWGGDATLGISDVGGNRYLAGWGMDLANYSTMSGLTIGEFDVADSSGSSGPIFGGLDLPGNPFPDAATCRVRREGEPMAACDVHGRLSPDGALLATWYRPDFSIVVDPMDIPPEVVADEAAWLARFDTLPAEVAVHELDTGVERYRTELPARTRITDFDGRFLVVAPCRVHDTFLDCPTRDAAWTIIDTTSRQPPISLPGAVVLLRPGGSGPSHAQDDPPMLRRGDRGPWVSFLQQALMARGQAIEVDGIFGPASEAAVRRLQDRAELDVDGIVGPATWAALDRHAAAWDGPLPLAAVPGFRIDPVDVSPSGAIVGTNTRDCVGPDEWGGYTHCVRDVVVWDGVAADPRVLRRGATAVGINVHDQVLALHEKGAEVIDVETGDVTALPTPPGVVRVRGDVLGDDLAFGALIIREADPDDDFGSPETEAFAFDLRSGALARIETGNTYRELVESGLSVRDRVLLGLEVGVLVVPSLDIPDEFGPGEVFGWTVDARGRVYGTSTYPAPAGCHTDFPCRRVYGWDPASDTLDDLGTPGSQHPWVADVNDIGEILAWDSGPDREHASVPWVWDREARRWNALPCPADRRQCRPTAIGDDGTVYGHVPGMGAVHWSPVPARSDVGPDILRPDGIGPYDFGSEMSEVVRWATAAFGAPTLGHGDVIESVVPNLMYICGEQVAARWETAALDLFFAQWEFDEVGLVSCSGPIRLVAWGVGSHLGLDRSASSNGARLTTTDGIGVGTTVAELFEAEADPVFMRWGALGVFPAGFHLGEPIPTERLYGVLDWDWVRDLQTALNDHGFRLAVDGEVGPRTRAALEAYRVGQVLGSVEDAILDLALEPDGRVQIASMASGNWPLEFECGTLHSHGLVTC